MNLTQLEQLIDKILASVPAPVLTLKQAAIVSVITTLGGLGVAFGVIGPSDQQTIAAAAAILVPQLWLLLSHSANVQKAKAAAAAAQAVAVAHALGPAPTPEQMTQVLDRAGSVEPAAAPRRRTRRTEP